MPYTQEQVDELSDAMSEGVLTVRHSDGRQVTFQSLDAMEKQRQRMLREINKEAGTRRRRTMRLYQRGSGL